MRKILASSLAAGALALTFAAPAAAVEDGKAELFVLHGIPGLTVDVYVNGTLTLDNFAPGDLAGPLSLDPGTYSVVLAAETSTDASSPILGPIDLPLMANTSYTAAAHLDAGGSPTAKLFTNNLDSLAAGEGRLTVRHIAAAPAVDILAGGSAIIEDLENPDEAIRTVPANTYNVAVAAAGTTTPVLGPTDLPVAAGKNTIVYAWGSLDDDTLALATQSLDVHSGTPIAVQAGTQGLADTGSTNVALIAGLAVLGMAAATGTVAVAVRRR